MRERVVTKESLGQDNFGVRMSAVFNKRTQPSSPPLESNRIKPVRRTSPPSLRATSSARWVGHPLARSRSPNVPRPSARPLPPQPHAEPQDRGTVAAAGRSVGDGPPRSSPRCPHQTTDPSGRQTDLGVGAAGSRGGGCGAEGLRRLGPPRSPEPRQPQPRRRVSGCRLRSGTRAGGWILRPGPRPRVLPASRGRCCTPVRRLAFQAARPRRNRALGPPRPLCPAERGWGTHGRVRSPLDGS